MSRRVQRWCRCSVFLPRREGRPTCLHGYFADTGAPRHGSRSSCPLLFWSTSDNQRWCLRFEHRRIIRFYDFQIGYWPPHPFGEAATLIASQAVLSGAFALIQQAIQLGAIPRLEVRQTSRVAGQVYVPQVNWLLAAIVLSLDFAPQTHSPMLMELQWPETCW